MTPGTHEILGNRRKPTRSILIVDDEPDIRAFLQMALEDEGYAVQTAANGAEALEVLRDGRPSVILLDLRMPGMDGQTFVETYRARATPEAPAVPIVVLTASRVPAEEAETLGVEGILRKPLEVDALLKELARHLTN